MKNKLMTAGLVGAAALAAWAAKDPVLMTVNGIDVPKSEFEYLYHKNSQQQLEAQPLEEYLEMFKTYKMKVADALAQGIDTTASFRKEMDQYRHELATPYMADSTYLNKLVDDSWNRSKQEAEAIHIMLLKKQGAPSAALRAKADSLRALLMNGDDFTQLASQYSEDRASAQKGGNMGFITVNRLPYHFEEAAFNTPEGSYSEVVESPVGYHILKGGRKRPARGTILAAHILKLTPPTATDEEKAAAKAWIDSIHQVLVADPSQFEGIATRESDDKGSARQGGLLPWFGAGQMVPEFDEAAFALADGEISEPVQSQFGWHIIKRLDHREPEGREALKAELLQRFSNPQDERHMMVRRNLMANLSRKHKARLQERTLAAMTAKAYEQGLDSAFYASFEADAAKPFYQLGKKTYTVGDFLASFRHSDIADHDRATAHIANQADLFRYRKLLEAEQDWLYDNVADYRNLVNEYRDGSLLYEVSVEKVWNRASQDTEGLEKFFEANRGSYTWQRPHAKGFLVQAANDSVADLVKARMAELPKAEMVQTIRREFPKTVSIERVLVEEGQNPMVDNLMFGAPAVKPANSAYTLYFMEGGEVIDAPQEAADVRGPVTSDYQNELERQWVEELRATYPVSVDPKVLKKVK